MSVLKSWWHAGLNCNAWFYRDRDGHEIDLLIQDALLFHPIEIKSSANPKYEEIAPGFAALERTGTKLSTGAVLCLAGENLPLSKNLLRINVGSI